jgi:methylenetetrahydrofolate dehydrogenase (NADP+)/methenyltetrahydrofolate cyclohydrolase
MKLLDGKHVSERILDKIAGNVHEKGIHPHLAVILVGEDPASHLYVSLKERAAKSVGVDVSLYKFSPKESQESVLKCVEMMSSDEEVDGILVQLPLPDGFDTGAVIGAIAQAKDVDGFHPENVRSFIDESDELWPVFPKAIISLIESSEQVIAGKIAVVLANSDEFGEMMTTALRKKGAEAQYILAEEIDGKSAEMAEADIVVTALGKPRFVTGEMLSKNAIVIDGGIYKEGEKVIGDVDMETLSDFEGYLSPVPGGVGPVTIACLLENVLDAALKRKGL